MLDAKFVREHIEDIKETIKRQKREELLPVVEKFLQKDEKWRQLKVEADTLRAERNKLSEEVNKTKKAGGDIGPVITKVKEIPNKIKAIEEEMEALDIKEELRQIPNVMHKDVPYGKSDEENPEIKRWGEHKEFSFPVKNHVEIIEKLGLADFEASARSSGNGFYYLKGDLALLNQALIQFAISKMREKKYTYIEPPLMVRREVLDAAMDADAIEQSIYAIDGDENLAMIGTAEHAILGMHEGETLDELPRKYFGYSMCFRREIGSHGINEKGLWRTHQFNKVEQFIFCLPNESWKLYDELMQNSEEILQALELPYRVIEICTGDLAVWKARSHDVEVWRPTTKKFGEVMSLSNCTTYQSADLGIRYNVNGEKGFVHTLNNTALATSRIMVAILENNQQEDGSVVIPEVLRGFMGKDRIE